MTRPMLCKEWKDTAPLSPCFMQPKLDGIRCIAKLNSYPAVGSKPFITLWSRNEKPLHLPHLQAPLLALFARLNNTEFFDGELYLHGKSFQDIASLVKRANHPLQDTISYHIYDRQLKDPWGDQKFGTRFYGGDWPSLSRIVKVPTFYVPDVDQANRHHAKFVAQGYEGSIYRTDRCLYEEGKRSPNLLKRKDWQEDDFLVLKVKEGKGKNAGTAIFECSSAGWGSNTFDVTAPGTYRNKKKLFDNADDYIDKLLSVRYQNLTDGGIPRFPIALGFKEDR